MENKVWTWEEALSNGLIDFDERIDFSRLYPPKIWYYWVKNGSEGRTRFIVSDEMTGRIKIADNTILSSIFVSIENYSEYESPPPDWFTETGEYIAKYVLSVEERGILATYISHGNPERKVIEGGSEDGCYFRFGIAFREKIIVKFEKDDKKIYLEYPLRDLYTLP